jgi:hypothetical protein
MSTGENCVSHATAMMQASPVFGSPCRFDQTDDFAFRPTFPTRRWRAIANPKCRIRRMGHFHAEHDFPERSPNSNCLVRDTAACLRSSAAPHLDVCSNVIRAEKSKSLGNFAIWHEIATSGLAFLLVPIASNNLECPQGVLTSRVPVYFSSLGWHW